MGSNPIATRFHMKDGKTERKKKKERKKEKILFVLPSHLKPEYIRFKNETIKNINILHAFSIMRSFQFNLPPLIERNPRKISQLRIFENNKNAIFLKNDAFVGQEKTNDNYEAANYWFQNFMQIKQTWVDSGFTPIKFMKLYAQCSLGLNSRNHRVYLRS